ncbi:hypothetical protein JKA74_00825 [Marivirga sp. S37H4]|uniref:Uncharacterized protein n=1 Tax=Marivirga aurantiaca TaxID=2802615 RepID=A0A935C4Y9_9BACT|nr:DUF6048 family protein [Marivirga aurantiaca]MBK6263561.1 hypothetical protein [Marivirga aurantiaca]
MLRYNYIILIAIALLAHPLTSYGQTEEEAMPEKVNKLALGLSLDYLKLHTLLLDESEKWEAAVNFKFYERVSLVGEYGLATLTPDDAYKNADYSSKGDYFRIGTDYHLTVTPGNYLLLGIRYSQAQFDESIHFSIENPIFPNENDEVDRTNLSAQWFEFVINSEKEVKRVFGKDIKDFMSIGFRLRLKSFLEYEDFEKIDTKRIPGYGMTNTSLNPEINLYLKFRLNIF